MGIRTRHPKRPSAAALRRLAEGTEPPRWVSPELTVKRRAAGIAGRVAQARVRGEGLSIRIDPRQFSGEAQHVLPVVANRQILAASQVDTLAHRRDEALEMAAEYSPAIVVALVEIALDQARSIKDRIAASKVVLAVAGLLDGKAAQRGADDARDPRDLDADSIRRLVWAAQARLEALEDQPSVGA
ncbi:MAG: hypothetical protein IT530_14135 [Burkholderiales bacterium]|nr:hypothetical protein [Burkholderiales bacterium]